MHQDWIKLGCNEGENIKLHYIGSNLGKFIWNKYISLN